MTLWLQPKEMKRIYWTLKIFDYPDAKDINALQIHTFRSSLFKKKGKRLNKRLIMKTSLTREKEREWLNSWNENFILCLLERLTERWNHRTRHREGEDFCHGLADAIALNCLHYSTSFTLVVFFHIVCWFENKPELTYLLILQTKHKVVDEIVCFKKSFIEKRLNFLASGRRMMREEFTQSRDIVSFTCNFLNELVEIVNFN